MRLALRPTAIALCALGLLPWALHGLERPEPASSFAAQIERFSEPEGTFDTDNLVSNEKSYLDVIGALVSGGVTGGAYIGVGPDQNFSYIARIRPTVAFIIDVRRDNLLLHLLFKALFARASNRAEYLSLLTGRPVPEGRETWKAASLEKILVYVEGVEATPGAVRTLRHKVDETIAGFGVPLSSADFETIDRFHRAFIDAGLALRFRTRGQPPRSYYPTFRELLLATDAGGRLRNYLASEEDFQFVRSLEARDRLIPVVGNVNGPHALGAIAAAIAERRERVSAFYISNVENYLFRDGTFPRFTDNLGRLPRDARSVMIRSIFGGSFSVSVVQSMDEMLADASSGKYRNYPDLVNFTRPWRQ